MAHSPALFEACDRLPDFYLVRSTGLDVRSSLKLAEWFGGLDNVAKPAAADFHSLTQNVEGASVRRVDRPAAATPARCIALQPDYSASVWTSEGNLRCRNFYLDRAFVTGIFREIFDRDPDEGDILEVNMCPDLAINDMLDLCALECIGDEDISPLKLDGWAVVLTEKILRTQSAFADRFVERAPHVLDARRQADLVAFIEAHIEESLTLDTLSVVARMDIYQLSRAFKAATGRTPYRYVLERRVARARSLLARGDDPIADIAYQCGFSSQQHMTGTFSKLLGVTPGRYRRERKG